MESITPHVISFGEVLWDLLPSGRVMGGAPANLAHRLKELGTSVALVTRVGSDELGDELKKGLADQGLDLDFVQQDTNKPTGTVPVTLSSKGDASYEIIKDVAYDYIESTPELIKIAQNCRAICFNTLIQRNEISRNALYKLLDAATHAVKVLDINLRKECYSPETIRQSLMKADILKLNREEAGVVSEIIEMKTENFSRFASEVMKRFHIQLVLVTCGSDGNYAFSDNGSELHIRGYKVPVVDTVGSGDNFTAAFLHKKLQGESLETCCLFANKIGAIVASKKGGMVHLTDYDLQLIEDFDRSEAAA